MSSRVPLWKPHWYMHILRWLRGHWIAPSLASSGVLTFFLSTWLLRHGHRVPVGVYVAIMGLVTAAMAIHEGATRWQKAAWLVFITALLVAEIRNLYVADREQALTFGKISDSLDATKKGLDATAEGIRSANTESQEQFVATMLRIQAAAKEQKKTFEWLFGGDAYTTVLIDRQTLQWEVATAGPQPLHDVYLNIYDPTRMRETAQAIHVPIIYPGRIQHLFDYKAPVPTVGESCEFQINIYQPNGYFTEFMTLHKVNGLWTIQNVDILDKNGKKPTAPSTQRPAPSR